MQSLHGAEFQQHLEYLREKSSVLPYSQLVAEFRKSVPAASADDATDACRALAASGGVLRHGELVYLRPSEVVAALRRVLPTDSTAAAAQLSASRAELAALEQARATIEARAGRRARLANWTFFGALATQWAVLFRLTYWELSWDVIEPVGFFMGGTSTMLSFAWFLRTSREFSYEALHKRVMSNYERRAFQRANFDIRDFNRVKRDVERLEDAMEAQAALAAEGAAAGEGGANQGGGVKL